MYDTYYISKHEQVPIFVMDSISKRKVLEICHTHVFSYFLTQIDEMGIEYTPDVLQNCIFSDTI